MSIRIDDLIKNENLLNTKVGSWDGWFIAKPLNKPSVFKRIRNAYRVLTNKSFAVHFYEDECYKR